MQRLNKSITMYPLPENATEISVDKIGNEWKLLYKIENSQKFVTLHNCNLYSSLMTVNIWNTAAFVKTHLPYTYFTFPFGKYKGKTVEEVPEYYVQWWWKNVIEEIKE